MTPTKFVNSLNTNYFNFDSPSKFLIVNKYHPNQAMINTKTVPGDLTEADIANGLAACESFNNGSLPRGGCVVAAIGNDAIWMPGGTDPDVDAYRQARRAAREARDAEADADNAAVQNQAVSAALGGIGQTLQRQQYINSLSAQLRTQQAQRPVLSYQPQSPEVQSQFAVAQANAVRAAQLQPATPPGYSTPTPLPVTSHAANRAQNCLSIKPGSVNDGNISSDSAIVNNSCGFKVNYSYCIQSDGSYFSCSRQQFGEGGVGPYGSDGLSIANSPSLNGRHFEISFLECSDDLLPSKPRFVGGSVRGACF